MRFWTINVLIAIDQLVNALCGGNADATISARVGSFALKSRFHEKETGEVIYRYWRVMEKVIDWCFLPIDGPGHCQWARRAESTSLPFRQNNDWFRAVMAIVVVLFCGVAGILFRVWALLASKK